MKAVKKLHNNLQHLNSLTDILRVIRKFAHSKEFNDYANNTAINMVKQVYSDNNKTWREAAAKSGRGKEIREALKRDMSGNIGITVQQQIYNNAELIKSIPQDIAVKVNEKILKETMDGTRSTDIVDYIKSMVPDISEKRAKLIARTETSKTSSVITRAKAKECGINFYIWETSSDQRVRDSHKHMQGVVCSFDIPILPEKYIGKKSTLAPGIAGEFPNDRCYPAPIEVEDINFPCKVGLPDKIVKMNKKQFYNYFNLN